MDAQTLKEADEWHCLVEHLLDWRSTI